MIVTLTATFVPEGSYYGIEMDEVTLAINNFLGTTLASLSLTGGTITGGLNYSGVQYTVDYDTGGSLGPYLTTEWTGYYDDDIYSVTGKVPLVPDNTKVCIVFNDPVLDTDGVAAIPKDTTYCYATSFDPFYISVDYFRSSTYDLFTSATDLELAIEIWMASKEADAETFCDPDPDGVEYPYFEYARQQYVLLKPLVRGIQYILSSGANSVTKRLADLEISVERGSGMSVRDAFKDWATMLKDLRTVLNSCGELSAGASVGIQVGRIANDYDWSKFGRYFQTYVPALGMDFYPIPVKHNHLFTDPYSTYWIY